MPVDRHHAFAAGTLYAVEPLAFRGLLGRLLRLPIRHLLSCLEWWQGRLVVNSFLDHAAVGTNCRVGPRAWCANAGPKSYVRLGDSVVCRGVLRSECFHPGRIVIDDYVYIGDDCIISCAERIEIGRLTLLAHGVQIFDNDSHPLDPISREQDYMTVTGQRSGPRPPIASAPIWIGERAWIGFNAIVTKGVCIGEGSVVAAGSVVISDVPPYTVVAGNPARVVKQLAPIDRPPLDEDENEV